MKKSPLLMRGTNNSDDIKIYLKGTGVGNDADKLLCTVHDMNFIDNIHLALLDELEFELPQRRRVMFYEDPKGNLYDENNNLIVEA